jgi:hypothetical protein
MKSVMVELSNCCYHILFIMVLLSHILRCYLSCTVFYCKHACLFYVAIIKQVICGLLFQRTSDDMPAIVCIIYLTSAIVNSRYKMPAIVGTILSIICYLGLL